ncbi:dihydrolipoyl dehydrogenase [Salinisphaera sp. P385]|uniref:Dihydrolipoyl dehydrogenase n=1 Tax=Spectribacter acetivorans TaxID=3075603 RepID=A0ABU3B825_9GAMM|nr:dihydrolipoyl dehydrogenase [Salinisphaera sp. P385]MDT0618609.1 dihydrolipoyl dehydrogenase [Salinisphaera sp. P385]
MQEKQVDVAIIGSGTAGLNARSVVDKAGGSWALIESGAYGTTCARVGCMPSKLLIAAADAAHEIHAAGLFGVYVDDVRIDGEQVLDRVRRERDRFAGFVVKDTQALPAEHRLSGEARFVGPTTLEVGDHTRVTANAVVIAAGSDPFIPPPFDAIRKHVITNDDVFELERLPKSLAVVGTGIIGLELGQAMARLGLHVVFFARSTDLGPLTDPDVKAAVFAQMDSELNLRLSTSIIDAARTDQGVQIQWRDAEDAEHEEIFDTVLVAAGRRPNIPDLNLAATGLELNSRGMPPWDPSTAQCGDLPIFLAGDASAHIPLLHEAADEGRIAGENAMQYPDIVAHARRTPLAVVFTDPQIAMAGQRYADLNTNDTEIGAVSFDDQGRARVMGRNRGLLRIYARRRCGTLLGAEMFGPRMEHIAHLLAWAIQQKLTVQQALEMPFYHPVVEEGLRTALRDLAYKLKVADSLRCEDMAEAPGC